MPLSSNTQNVSNGLTVATSSRRYAGGALARRLRDKGWTVRDAADYLGVSRQRLYMVFNDPGRARLWDCAIGGMPQCTPEITRLLKEARQKRARVLPPKPKLNLVEFEIGDIIRSTKHAGIADEGIEGHIGGLRGEGKTLEILVVMPEGKDWFPREDFHEHFAGTGRNRNR